MLEYIEVYLQYNKELDKICIEKHFDEKTQNLLKNWLKELIFSYKKENNFLESLSLEKYVYNYFCYLKSIENIIIFEIEDVLNNVHNYFYREIFKPQKKEDYYFAPYHMRKEINKYILDSHGDYVLTTIGVSFEKNRSIQLINAKSITINFHHELTHIGQFLKNKYHYPSIFPYSKEIQTMFLEAEAYLQEKIFLGESIVLLEDWNEQKIKTKRSSFYCQLYILIFLFIPEEIRMKWKNEGINLNLVADKFLLIYSEFFAIITILIAKSNCIGRKEDNLFETINKYSNFCYLTCNKIEEKTKEKYEDYQSYQFGKYLTSNIKQILCKNLSTENLFAILIQKIEEFLITEKDKKLEKLNMLQSFHENHSLNKKK